MRPGSYGKNTTQEHMVSTAVKKSKERFYGNDQVKANSS
jgi:hypothetical protein